MTSRKFGSFLKPPPPIVTLFITKALVMLSKNPWHPLPSKYVTSFMDETLVVFQHYISAHFDEDSKVQSKSFLVEITKRLGFGILKKFHNEETKPKLTHWCVFVWSFVVFPSNWTKSPTLKLIFCVETFFCDFSWRLLNFRINSLPCEEPDGRFARIHSLCLCSV